MTREPIEIFTCERVDAYLDSYLLDQVPPPERRGMRLHIHRCPACFAKVTQRDPLQLFAPLADEERPEESWQRFWPAIREGIEREEIRRSWRRVWIRAAAVLAVVASVGLIGSRFVLHREAPAPVAALQKGTGAPQEAGQKRTAAAPLPQTVERVRSSGSRDVQVYSMNYYDSSAAPASGKEGSPGAGRLTELVLIVDAGIEL